MLELKRTIARAAFKDLLGQANHFLITILVGLNAVRNGAATYEEEFRTSWNPQSVVQSADRSRMFAIDLALIRAVDALDMYLTRSRRKPSALPSSEFAAKMDGTGLKVSKRLDVFCEFLPALAPAKLALLKLAIDWRNLRVHSLAEDRLANGEEEVLRKHAADFRLDYSGLEIAELLRHYRAGVAPTFKEAASVVRLCHEAVEHFDGHLLARLDIETYVLDAMALILAKDRSSSELRVSCIAIWGSEKRAAKVLRTLRLIGAHEVAQVTAREVPTELVDRLLNLSPEQAQALLVERVSLS